jgi:hypothetical protein
MHVCMFDDCRSTRLLAAYRVFTTSYFMNALREGPASAGPKAPRKGGLLAPEEIGIYEALNYEIGSRQLSAWALPYC